MVLYLCVLIVFSLCRESLKLILTTDPFLRWFCHVMHLLVFALTLGGVQPFAYPLAKLSTTWANTDASLMHHVTYRDGSVARAALLRLNPGDYGRCFTFGFFCTNHRSSPCVDFLLGVAVVYSNRGGMMSITAGILQVVWSTNRGRPVREGTMAQLTASGDLVLKSVVAVCSVGTVGRSVAGVCVGTDGDLVLL
jgi:hypothetical protein